MSEETGIAEEETLESPALQLAKGGKQDAKKTTTKTKAKTKAKPKAKVAVDLIVDTAHDIENLTHNKAILLMKELAEHVEFSYFKLGGVLTVIQEQGWYVDSGHDKFEDFVEAELGFKSRKARYLMDIYKYLIESGISWESVKIIEWSKLKEMVKELTPENVKDWVDVAKDMTVLQLRDYVKQQKKGTLPSNEQEEEIKAKTSTLSFKVHEDQKEVIKAAIDQAKEEADTEVDTVALEAICMGYMSGGAATTPKVKPADAPKALSLQEAMEGHSWEEVLGEFEKIWPNVNLTVEID